jgi:hypothetical protein
MRAPQKAGIVQKATKNADDQLAEHLKHAEHHVIEALKLFSGPKDTLRRVGYYSRLISAQETITALYREELVRIRGPIKGSVRSRRKK